MRHVPPHPLWLGHSGDRSKPRALHAAGIRAIIDVAIDEPPAPVAREIAYCRFPLLDGSGNPPWLLRAVIDTAASLLRSRTNTLICCSAGMSRSPSIAAAAIARLTSAPPAAVLADLTRGHPADISPGLWGSILAAAAPWPRH